MDTATSSELTVDLYPTRYDELASSVRQRGFHQGHRLYDASVKDLAMCANWQLALEIIASIGLLWSSVRLAAFELALFFMWQYASGK